MATGKAQTRFVCEWLYFSSPCHVPVTCPASATPLTAPAQDRTTSPRTHENKTKTAAPLLEPPSVMTLYA